MPNFSGRNTTVEKDERLCKAPEASRSPCMSKQSAIDCMRP
jgi:hypothetical protein